MFIRSYKYRMYPNREQRSVLDRNFGATRFLWNSLVANFNSYGTDSFVKNMSEVQVKMDNPWMKESISYALQQKRIDFFEFMKQFFNKKRKKKLGRPNFKKKGVSSDSFRLPGQCLGYMKSFNFERKTIKIPKINDPIKVKFDRTFNGHVKSITLSKNNLNEYYITVCIEEEISPLAKTRKDIGIDLGLNDLLILSDGTKFQNPKFYRKTQAALAKAQRKLSKKKYTSKRYFRQKTKVAKIHKKISRQREWYYHNISIWLVREFDTIIIEDLNISGMMKNRKLSKSIADASWSSLANMISYKTKWYGKELIQVGRFYASSQICSSCDHKDGPKELSTRKWICSSCGTHHDRDINAARNIYKEGMLKQHGLISAELPEYSRGEIVRPSWFLNQKADFNETARQTISL